MRTFKMAERVDFASWGLLPLFNVKLSLHVLVKRKLKLSPGIRSARCC
jgi:hypothetical protein